MSEYDPELTYRIHFTGDVPELVYEAEWDDEWGCWCLVDSGLHVRDNGDGLPETDMVEVVRQPYVVGQDWLRDGEVLGE